MHAACARSPNHSLSLSQQPPSQELGVSILQDLQRQRETIVHASDTLRGADDSIASARRILGVMSRRVAANKAIAWGVAGALGLCVLVILWAKIRR